MIFADIPQDIIVAGQMSTPAIDIIPVAITGQPLHLGPNAGSKGINDQPDETAVYTLFRLT
jgi:hypothetical protein